MTIPSKHVIICLTLNTTIRTRRIRGSRQNDENMKTSGPALRQKKEKNIRKGNTELDKQPIFRAEDAPRSMEKPDLKFAVVSDPHGYLPKEHWGLYNMRRAICMMAAKNVDAFLMAGDLSDRGDQLVYALYGELYRKEFRRNPPIQIACAGNHEFWVSENRKTDTVLKDFSAGIGEREENPVHKIVRGYDFISVSPFDGLSFSPEACASLKKMLTGVSKRNPGKPIFVLTHFPPANTVLGSVLTGSPWDEGQRQLRKILQDYPQVISFSGHTHAPVEDERCIWQGEFTAVAVGSLSYGMTNEKALNVISDILPFAREVTQAVYAEVFPDRVEIHRYNVTDGQEIKVDRVWSVELPYRPEKAAYTAARAEMRTAPEFAPGTPLLIRYDFGYAYLAFAGAKHDDFVREYWIDIAEHEPDGGWRKAGTYNYIADFYRLKKNRESWQFLKLPEGVLSPGKCYRFTVTPVESFGKAGKPLELIAEMPNTFTFRKTPAVYPQE